MKHKKIFISGKITDDPNYKEKFNAVAERLAEFGYIPLNPAILPQGMTVSEYMKIGLAMIDCADCVLMLKDWQDSRGAKIEYAYAKYCSKSIVFLEDMEKDNGR